MRCIEALGRIVQRVNCCRLFIRMITVFGVLLVFPGQVDAADLERSRGLRGDGHLKLALDPGHGGEENGAEYYGKREKDINLQLAYLVKEGLEQYENITVFLTRTEDETVGLKERADRAAEVDADLLISLHCNASVSHVSQGASVYISTGEYKRKELMDFADLFLGEFEAIGLSNAGTFARMTQMGRRRADGSFDDYYGVLRHSYNHGIPAILIEHCYMDSPADKDYVSSKEGIGKLAEADVNAIAAFYGLTGDDGIVYEGRHAVKYGASSKAVQMNYYKAPRLTGIELTEFDGKSPGMAEFQISVEDEAGINRIYLVYRNAYGSSVTIPLIFHERLCTGVHMLKGYVPENMGNEAYVLSYVGMYNDAGYDAGYSSYDQELIGFGACEWQNSFSYQGEADLSIVDQGVLSIAHIRQLDEEMRLGIRKRQDVYPVEYRKK